MATATVRNQTAALPRSWWWGFLPFAAASAVHIGARAAEATDIAEPTKLTLMPLLAVAVLWGARGLLRGPSGRKLPAALLLAALFFSWIGDGAAAFFPSAPELPVMLGSFGIAHICYIWLLARYAQAGPLPRWALVFGLWWVLMLLVLWPALGGLAFAVAAYGIVLAGTAATAARCRPMVAAGGLLFLASDTVLAGRIFLPGQMPDWTNPLVMLTYCAGQGLIAAGVLRTWRGVR
ncbi:lysoplasmalogenase [Arthrobacter sp. zg-Y769]|uniref:lysoplasmalogenase n=1 Tax=Arthrobacter sp. zg-Y769 TaxID=2894191 RepID=UPI001E404735|nr:lysoplasmalogenase [Arthrobacter sp. zg-Y769]MCC9204522.1 lysoplasmalogenase [Arthrobacter sp. zg-Y769]